MAEQRLDVHYQGLTADGNRLRVTAFRVDPPLKTTPLNLGTEDKPLWVDFVAGHTAWHDENDEDDDGTDRCFPPDPEFDEEPDD